MKHAFTLTLLAAAILALTPRAHAQDAPRPDAWRGLRLDHSTPEDAIKLLGKPKKDAMGEVRVRELQARLTERTKQKIFRNLQFKDVEGLDAVYLSFLDDKLVVITLDIKKEFSPHSLSASYGMEFQPVIGGIEEALTPRGDLVRDQGKIYPKTYPTVYYMVAASPTSFVTAMVGNAPSFAKALGQVTIGLADQEGTFPGKVGFVTLVSRQLENRDGIDALK